MRLNIVWLPAAFAVLAALPTRAYAQTERASPGAAMGADYTERRGTGSVEVTFFIDNLTTDLGGPTGDSIRRPPGAVRVGLLRPRLTFIPELVKSGENL